MSRHRDKFILTWKKNFQRNLIKNYHCTASKNMFKLEHCKRFHRKTTTKRIFWSITIQGLNECKEIIDNSPEMKTSDQPFQKKET
jgi:hypothetical protein